LTLPDLAGPSVLRIIVTPTPYLFGMSRMFQILGGPKWAYVISG
jgi:hypothetical protein